MHIITTTTVLWPFVQDYLGEPIPEEIFTHSPSWSSSNLYQLLPSTTIHRLASSLFNFTYLTIFLHNCPPSPLWSASWSGALHFIFHTFLYPNCHSEHNDSKKKRPLTAKLSASCAALCSRRFLSVVNASFCFFIFNFSSSRASHHITERITAKYMPHTHCFNSHFPTERALTNSKMPLDFPHPFVQDKNVHSQIMMDNLCFAKTEVLVYWLKPKLFLQHN